MAPWWPKRVPILHRALDEPLGKAGEPAYEEGFEMVDALATRRRVRKKDSFKRNALHIACMNQPTLELVQLLVDLYPEAVGEQDKLGRLPIHCACANGAPLSVIEFLLNEDPESIYETTDRGSTPLFCAIENKCSLTTVKFLVERDPDAMQLNHYKLGKTPVHAAVSRGADLEVVQYLLEQRPQSYSEKDSWGKTPLACACTCATDEDGPNATKVLAQLMDKALVEERDRAGMLPLHLACSHNASLENVELLLHEFNGAICEQDNQGRLPLHAACTNPRINPELIEMLRAAYPPALKTFDKNGTLPLHLAIQRKLPNEIILNLIEKEAGAVRTKEASTLMYPLHMAAKTGASPDLLEKLVKIYPKAIDAVDKEGNTVFHVACTYRQLNLAFAELLLDYCSYDAIRKPNQEGMLPLHIACQHRAPMPVLQLLIDHYPEALVIKDKKGNVPLHKAFQTVTEMYVLVRLAQEDHHALNKINKQGLTPQDCANELMQKKFRRARYWYNLRKAYCPVCILLKPYQEQAKPEPGIGRWFRCFRKKS